MSPAKRRDVRRLLHVVEGEAGGVAASDEALIEAVIQGDDRIAADLYDRLVSVVDRTLYRVMGRREVDHEDLVQASFEQIVKTLTRNQFARACSLRTWAASVATRVALNALRARRRERAVLDRRETPEANESSNVAHDNPERDVVLRKEIDRLRSELSKMAPERAETVVLHEVLGYDLAEIAALTGVSIAAAQSRLSRGRRELFERLQARPKSKEPA